MLEKRKIIFCVTQLYVLPSAALVVGWGENPAPDAN